MPFDRRRYPKDWEAISLAIKEREGWRCKFCGIRHRAFITRLGGKGPTMIVLTVAHLENPDPMDCRDENLAALCQRCHLKYDRERVREGA